MNVHRQSIQADGVDLIIVRNPFDGKTVDTICATEIATIPDVVKRAMNAANEFRYSMPYERRTLLNGLADQVRRRNDAFAELICDEVGKTITEARNETRRAVNTLLLSGDASTFLDGETLHCGIVERGADRIARLTYEAAGVVGAITPFNYPLNLLCHKLGPAIAAGNAVVAKPSPKAPLAAAMLRECAIEAGWPKDLFQVIHGGAEQAIALARSQINILSFTGGPAAGLALKQASGLIRTLMELGGNDPLFVLPDAAISAAVKTAVSQRFEIAGQSCAAVKKLYLHEAIADEFVERLRNEVATVRAGDPRDSATDMGPVIDEPAAAQVCGRIEQAIASGAQLLAGGARKGALVEPTVLDHVPPDAVLFAEETFGPVISIRRFSSLQTAIDEVNASQYGLQAGVFTNDHNAIRELGRQLRVGGLMINEGPDFRAEHVPFGGVKQSGLGREGIRITAREMSELKVIID